MEYMMIQYRQAPSRYIFRTFINNKIEECTNFLLI